MRGTTSQDYSARLNPIGFLKRAGWEGLGRCLMTVPTPVQNMACKTAQAATIRNA